jgi:hypothetical protein
MPKHPKAKERQGHLFGEENSANVRRHISECIPYAAYDHILKGCRSLHKWCLLSLRCEISFVDKLERNFHSY